MKTWKLVAGILSCILFTIVAFQSCAVGVGEIIGDGGISGECGVLVSILMLTGGIVSIVTRKSGKRGGNIALIILFGIAALIGFAGADNFPDLEVWAYWCLINAAMAVVALSRLKKKS